MMDDRTVLNVMLDRVEKLARENANLRAEGNEMNDRINKAERDHYHYRQAAEDKVREMLSCIGQMRTMLITRKVLAEKLPPVPKADIPWEEEIPF